MTPRVGIVHAAGHGAELATADEAIANLEEMYVTGDVYRGPDGAKRYKALLSRLGARRERLAALPSTPARIDYRPTGLTFQQKWEASETHERRRLMTDAGFEVRVAHSADGLSFAFQLDRELEKRAAEAAAGGLPERPGHDVIHASWEAPAALEIGARSVDELAAKLAALAEKK